MSLTIAALGPDGAPDDELDIDEPDHFLLLKEARRLGLTQISRMHDYYDDAEIDFAPKEVPTLTAEAETLRRLGDAKLTPWLEALIALGTRAVSKSIGLSVLTD